jgi:predicted TIM-barrel fold metal-dependent hydrolase
VLNSLISEGVFVEFPRLKIVLMESGVTWLPAWMWRANKTWRGVRAEVPWLDKSPADYAREHVRLTVQPFDVPPEQAQLQKIIEEIDCDEMLLFASDYPHWHYDGSDALPDGLPDALTRKILTENALKTYSRLS